MFGAFEAFRVKLIDIFRSGRAGGEPTADGDNLQATDRCVVARRTCQFGGDSFAREFGGRDGFRREFLERILLLGGGWCIDPCVIGCPKLSGQVVVVRAWISSSARGNLRGQQAKNQSILVRAPN